MEKDKKTKKNDKVKYTYSTKVETMRKIRIAAAYVGCPINEFIDKAVEIYINNNNFSDGI